ncbi:hypothetical protein TVAG_392630 [Trichomonas vaginalis G3]|uniref:Uncharacterized protein n=1 Tax=Trichomonas vaginalis (strain ATCC PRA-98 / G3) TaxID=412133 RepID=A2DWW4_TRIV3|nr:ribonuclease inhibitor domain-containing protein [Trichomonas vaginalis G3]EAY15146.1 hypothetical protein TVAG_392630 [Trichomonas vaginalis G3]KAI5499162.1 ribonuclease inhibitor domain-containing protein [Trichomonas vaginalis G3]|eukprot:XP_001327369.1 hypothetical protein [Trichomonas vaginalis G3]
MIGGDLDELSPAYSHGSFSQLNLQEFPPVEQISTYDSLDFSFNPISSFKTLPVLPLLEDLDLQSTNIKSFEFAQCQPSLKMLNFKNTPIAAYEGSRIMSIITLGSWIEEINQEKVTEQEHQIAERLSPRVKKLLTSGWILTAINTPYLMNQNSNQSGSLDEILKLVENTTKNEYYSSSESYSSQFEDDFPTKILTNQIEQDNSKESSDNQFDYNEIPSFIDKTQDSSTSESESFKQDNFTNNFKEIDIDLSDSDYSYESYIEIAKPSMNSKNSFQNQQKQPQNLIDTASFASNSFHMHPTMIENIDEINFNLDQKEKLKPKTFINLKIEDQQKLDEIQLVLEISNSFSVEIPFKPKYSRKISPICSFDTKSKPTTKPKLQCFLTEAKSITYDGNSIMMQSSSIAMSVNSDDDFNLVKKIKIPNQNPKNYDNSKRTTSYNDKIEDDESIETDIEEDEQDFYNFRKISNKKSKTSTLETNDKPQNEDTQFQNHESPTNKKSHHKAQKIDQSVDNNNRSDIKEDKNSRVNDKSENFEKNENNSQNSKHKPDNYHINEPEHDKIESNPTNKDNNFDEEEDPVIEPGKSSSSDEENTTKKEETPKSHEKSNLVSESVQTTEFQPENDTNMQNIKKETIHADKSINNVDEDNKIHQNKEEIIQDITKSDTKRDTKISNSQNSKRTKSKKEKRISDSKKSDLSDVKSVDTIPSSDFVDRLNKALRAVDEPSPIILNSSSDNVKSPKDKSSESKKSKVIKAPPLPVPDPEIERKHHHRKHHNKTENKPKKDISEIVFPEKMIKGFEYSYENTDANRKHKTNRKIEDTIEMSKPQTKVSNSDNRPLYVPRKRSVAPPLDDNTSPLFKRQKVTEDMWLNEHEDEKPILVENKSSDNNERRKISNDSFPTIRRTSPIRNRQNREIEVVNDSYKISFK